MTKIKIQPPFLKSGDEVMIVSPSFAIDRENMNRAAGLLESWGLKIHFGRNALKINGPFAGTDKERMADFQKAVNDKRIKAVFCSRGGYGLLRIIDKIDFSNLTRYPRWFVGFSDVTALHLWLSERCNMISIHGEMPLNYLDPCKSAETTGSLYNALFGVMKPIEWMGKSIRSRRVSGEITGGNLSLLFSMIGTPAEPDTSGKILFVEEVGEYLYRLDRMLMSLKLAGKLKTLSALVAGGFTDMEETRIPWGKSPVEMITDITTEYDYPVIFNFPAGHVDDNRSFYIGKEALIEVRGNRVLLSYP